MTVKEIKQNLDELGIEYDDKLKKEDLLKLLEDTLETEEQDEQENNEPEKEYVVIHRFKDLQDNDKLYAAGDKYDASEMSDERIAELSSKNNKIGKVLIRVRD